MLKIKKILPLFVLFTCLTGCNAEEKEPQVETHEHSFKTEWSNDEASHWKDATCEHTDLSKDRGAHIDSNNDKKCDICNYQLVIAHEHTFKTEWSNDEASHWKDATCEHTELSKDRGAHIDLDENNLCDICGYAIPQEVVEPEMKDLILYEETDVMTLVNKMIEGQEISDFILSMLTGVIQGYEELTIGEGRVTYKRYTFNYPSTSIDGSPILLSGALTIPHLDGTPKFGKIVVSSHPTFTDLYEAPSHGFDLYCIPCIAGCAVIEFDLLGYGITSDQPVDYHCRHLSSRNTIDGILKAYDLIESYFNKKVSDLDVFNIGYSQGGYDSLSLLRYLELDATDEEKERVVFKKTLSGSGAYNPFLLLEESLKKDDFAYSEYILLAAMSAYAFHPEKLNGIKYEDFLTEKGLELQKILELKDDETLQAFKTKVIEGTEELYVKGPRDIFKEELFDENSNLFKALKEAVQDENLLDGSWNPSGDVEIYYGLEDEMVTAQCSLSALELWKNLDNVEDMKLSGLFGKDHRSLGIEYYYMVVATIYDSYDIDI